MELTEAVAKHVLEIVDAGLVRGLGKPIAGKMCVEAAVCFALGEPHGDSPSCVGRAVRAFKVRLNDARWSSDAARSAGMRQLAIAQLGSDQIDQRSFANEVVLETVRQILPMILRRVKTKTEQKELDAIIAECVAATDLVAARKSANAAKEYAAAAAYATAYADAAAATAAAATTAAAAVTAADSILIASAAIALKALVRLGSIGAQWLHLCGPQS